MNTLRIVCTHCGSTNKILIEESKADTLCQKCSHSLLDTKPLACSEEVFQSHLHDNDIPILVDFYSPDCAPCMKMAPDFESTASSFALEVRFLKINTQDYPELALRYGVNTLPTIIAFKKSQELNRFTSALGKEQLHMWAESLIQMNI